MLFAKLWWLIPLIIVAKLSKHFAPRIKGKSGEGIVKLAAFMRLDPRAYKVLHDVTLLTSRGTTQIDHVIVSVHGIFVVETKNYSGWIFGTEKQAKWTQMHYKKKRQFQNPLRQNYGHICALSEMLGLPKEIFRNVVCFMGEAKFKTERPEGVCIQGSYITYIKSFHERVLSPEQVDSICQTIKSGMLERSIATNRRHVRNVQMNRHSTPETNEKTCPKCGAAMVLRKARKGANAGKQFWGCSTFPSCRGTAPFVD